MTAPVSLADVIAALPVDVVFDHIGWPDLAAGPSEPGFARLCALLAEGRTVHLVPASWGETELPGGRFRLGPRGLGGEKIGRASPNHGPEDERHEGECQPTA